jgi:8-oxo-dGTP pyrophosphatase MutT (NUDIX family)
LEDFRRVVRAHRPTKIPAEGIMKQAAVAAILREREGAVEVLFIRRAEHPKDPWSGHMAFPGGRVDPEDQDAFAAALRETREELALDLGVHAQHLGELSHLVTVAHGKPLPLIIVPFVFELAGDPAVVVNHEVEEAVWVPLAFLLDKANRSTLPWTFAGATITLPCYRYEGRVIWGLTLKMLDELLALVAPKTRR